MNRRTSKTRGVLILTLAAWCTAWIKQRTSGRRLPAADVATKAKPRPAHTGTPPLHFGAAARRKVRTTRFKARVGLVGLIAALVGLPGANLGLNLINNAFSGDADEVASAADLGGVTTSESAAGMLRFKGNLFKNRPTPSPRPTETQEPAPVVEEETTETAPEPVAPAPAGSITEILYAAAAEFGVDPGYLVAVAQCESGLNPGAVNPAGYHGLFQFDESTWAAYGYGSIYDATAQARTAARMLAAGMASRWPNCA